MRWRPDDSPGSQGLLRGRIGGGTGGQRDQGYWSPRERKLSLNERPIRRLADYFGVLRAVVFCSEDLALVKGPSQGRRRFLDLLLAQTVPGYLTLLMRYAKALRSRNALLKQALIDLVELDGFTLELVQAGEALIAARREFVPALAPRVQSAFRRIAAESDALSLHYQPGVAGDFAVALSQSRTRERALKTTVVGPHRDDLTLLVNDRAAAPFTSEGQKRTLAIALKLAQAEHLAEVHGTPPLLLIDDVMGELDARRRAAFVPLLQHSFRAGGQVFMTCTEENWPRQLGCDLQRWKVEQGHLARGAE